MHREDGGTRNGRNPQSMTGAWVKYKGFKGGGSHSHWKRRHMQARGAGRRDECRRLVSGGCGRHPGGRRLDSGEELGSGFKQR